MNNTTNVKLERVNPVNLRTGDMLYRVDDGYQRAMFIGVFQDWFSPEIMMVFNPVGQCSELIYDLPSEMLVLQVQS